MQCSRIRLRAISRGIASNLTPRATNYLYRWYIRRLTLFFFYSYSNLEQFFFLNRVQNSNIISFTDAENNDFVWIVETAMFLLSEIGKI